MDDAADSYGRFQRAVASIDATLLALKSTLTFDFVRCAGRLQPRLNHGSAQKQRLRLRSLCLGHCNTNK